MTTVPNTTLIFRIKKLTLIIFGLALFYFGVQLLHYHYLLVTFPYQLESFEGAMLLTTNLLLKGENPYALANMPVAINVYGINYHLFVYPFARIWGSTCLVHRAVSAFFLLLSCGLFFVVLRRHKIGILHSLSAVLILYASLLYRYTAIAKPDGLGLFLFLLSVFIVYLAEYSMWSLVISVVLGIAAFYTKPYFILSIPYLATYVFLFVSKKKAVIYGFITLLLLTITVFIVNMFFETYFVNTFFNHINVATSNLNQLRLQLEFFSMYNSGILLIFVIYFSFYALDKIKSSSLGSITLNTIKQQLTQRIDLSHAEKPLIRASFPLTLYCFILSFCAFYFKLGRHNGNIMTYAYHLITPFFLIYIYSLLNAPLQKSALAKRRENYNYTLLLPCILASLYLLASSASYLKDSPEWTDVSDWQQIERITASYQNVMNSQVLVSLLLEQNKPVYDTGQTEFFPYSHYSFEWLSGWLLPNEDIAMQWVKYESSIREAVQRQEFDAVIVTPRERRLYLSGLQDHYIMVKTMGVCMFHTAQCALLEIWEPKAVNPE